MKTITPWILTPILLTGALMLAGIAYPASVPRQWTDHLRGADITIYQTNIAHVAMNFTATFEGGKAEVQIPGSAIPYSLRVTDSRIVSWRLSSQVSLPPVLQEGDSVTVRTQSVSYIGTYIGTHDGYVALNVDSKTALVDLDAVVSIEVNRLVSIPDVSSRLLLVLEGNLTGTHEIPISFLARGVGWLAGSELDLSSRIITTRAFVQSSDNWTDSSVRLVVGEPKVVFAPMLLALYPSERSFEMARASLAVEFVGPYYTFVLPSRIDLRSGEQLSIRLLTGELAVVQFHLWRSSDPRYQPSSEQSAELSLNVSNLLNTPIPWGFSNFYEGSDWIGSDSNPYIPIGATRTLSPGPSRDIGVVSEIVSTERLSEAMRYSVQITVRNYGRTTALVVLKQGLPSPSTITYKSDLPVETGTTLTWTLTLEPGSTKTVCFTFEVPLRW